jgi:hypothetical protein
VHDVGVATKLPRLKQAQLKTIAVVAHGYPQVQRGSEELETYVATFPQFGA